MTEKKHETKYAMELHVSYNLVLITHGLPSVYAHEQAPYHAHACIKLPSLWNRTSVEGMGGGGHVTQSDSRRNEAPYHSAQAA